jgi:hypothetical protein
MPHIPLLCPVLLTVDSFHNNDPDLEPGAVAHLLGAHAQQEREVLVLDFRVAIHETEKRSFIKWIVSGDLQYTYHLFIELPSPPLFALKL